jgi:hypothetical protein
MIRSTAGDRLRVAAATREDDVHDRRGQEYRGSAPSGATPGRRSRASPSPIAPLVTQEGRRRGLGQRGEPVRQTSPKRTSIIGTAAAAASCSIQISSPVAFNEARARPRGPSPRAPARAEPPQAPSPWKNDPDGEDREIRDRVAEDASGGPSSKFARREEGMFAEFTKAIGSRSLRRART